MYPKVVFIDFDGTLVNSLPALYRLYDNFIKQFGKSGTKEEFAHLNGLSLPEIIEYLNKKYSFDLAIDELQSLYKKTLTELYQSQIDIFPGVKDCLSDLLSHQVRLGIVTSAPIQLAQAMIQIKGIDSFFERVITAENLKKGKPDPEIYYLALNIFQIEPEAAIAIEDSVNGILAATQANIPTIQFLNDDSTNAPVGTYPIFQAKSWNQIQSYFA